MSNRRRPRPPSYSLPARPDYGPGKEPQSVRDAWDAHLHTQHEAAPEPGANAS